jgi:hypothetical protein
MEKLTKKDLHLAGSAKDLMDLGLLVIDKMYWETFIANKSERYESRLGQVYDISNARGLVTDAVAIVGKRASFYWIK